MRGRPAATQSQLEAAKLRVKQIESERKQRDLEIEAKKSQIEKYLNQQLQTRKNEEYKALTHEIEMAKEVIFKIEDAEIVLMEQAEAAQKEVARATTEAAAAKKLLDDQIGQLDQREANLKKEFAELTGGPRATGVRRGRIHAQPLRADFQEQGRKRGGGRGAQRVRRLPHEAARAGFDQLPGAGGGNRHLSELRPDFVFQPRHGSEGGGMNILQSNARHKA